MYFSYCLRGALLTCRGYLLDLGPVKNTPRAANQDINTGCHIFSGYGRAPFYKGIPLELRVTHPPGY